MKILEKHVRAEDVEKFTAIAEENRKAAEANSITIGGNVSVSNAGCYQSIVTDTNGNVTITNIGNPLNYIRGDNIKWIPGSDTVAAQRQREAQIEAQLGWAVFDRNCRGYVAAQHQREAQIEAQLAAAAVQREDAEVQRKAAAAQREAQQAQREAYQAYKAQREAQQFPLVTRAAQTHLQEQQREAYQAHQAVLPAQRAVPPKFEYPSDRIGEDIEATEGESQCVMCLTNVHKTVNLPCGHICLCFACARAIAESSTRTCPMCRIVLTGIIPFYTA